MQYNSYEKKQCGKIQTTRPASNTYATNSSIAYMPVVLISDKSYDFFFLSDWSATQIGVVACSFK